MSSGAERRPGFPDWLVRRLEGEGESSSVDRLNAVSRRFEDLRVDLFPEGDRDRLRAVIAYSESGAWVASEAVRSGDTNPISDALDRLAEKVSKKSRETEPAAEGTGGRKPPLEGGGG